MKQVVVFLPEYLLYIASKFATCIVFRDFQQYILIKPVANGGVQIHSTDGRRACRITVNSRIWVCKKQVLINRRVFPRPVQSLRVVSICGSSSSAAQVLSGHVSKLQLIRPISPEMILMKSNIYPNMDHVWPQSISDYTNTVSFNVTLLLNFLEKVKELADEAVKRLRLVGDSEKLTDEAVEELELLAAGVVNVKVQTRQDNASMIIFTAYNVEELEIVLETPIQYEDISFNGESLLDFLKLVKRYSSGLVTMTIIRTSLKKSGQFLFTAEIQQGFLESVNIEYLLMPIVR